MALIIRRKSQEKQSIGSWFFGINNEKFEYWWCIIMEIIIITCKLR